MLRHARQVRLLDVETALALRGDDADTPSIPLAVNADSLSTWFLDALALVRGRTDAVFDLHREDQRQTAALLRSGVVMAAVTAEAEPVQGCSSVALGIDRYRAVAAPSFISRYLPDTPTEHALFQRLGAVPRVDYDHADDLQERFVRRLFGHDSPAPRHYVPTSAVFRRAVELGFGWGLLPEGLCSNSLEHGSLVELTPSHWVDVPLWWQRWNLSSPLLLLVTEAVQEVAALRLRPVDR